MKKPTAAQFIRAGLRDAEQIALIHQYLRERLGPDWRAKVDALPEMNEIAAPAPAVVGKSCAGP